MKLLIVDDEQSVRESTRMLIDSKGCGITQILEAGSGREALQLVQQESPSVVLLDMNMPGMDGPEVMRQLVKMNTSAQIVVLSAYDNFEYCRQALLCGAVDYLLKPVHAEQLNTLLSKLCKNSKPEENKQQQTRETAIPCDDDAHLTASIENFLSINRNKTVQAVRVFLQYPQTIALQQGGQEMAQLQVIRFLKGEIPDCVLVKSLFSGELLMLRAYDEMGKSYDYGRLLRSLTARGLDCCFCISRSFPGKVAPQVLRESCVQAFCNGNLLQDSKVYYDERPQMITVTQEIAVINYIQILSCAKNLRELRMAKAGAESLKNTLFNSETVTLNFLYRIWHAVSGLFNLPKEDEREIFENLDAVMILDHIFAIVETQMLYDEQQGNGLPVQTDQIMVQICEYLVHECSNKITLQMLSDKFYLSKGYICKSFKASFGMNITTYLRNLRLNRALFYLQNTDASITEIAYQVGFTDCSYFIKSFREEYGITPLEIRKQNGKVGVR